MRKIILSLIFIFLSVPVFAAVPIDSGYTAVSITDNATTHSRCRGVWIGTTQNDDFYVNGSWIAFQGATAGTVIPVQATGARVTSGSAAPTAGDVVFLY